MREIYHIKRLDTNLLLGSSNQNDLYIPKLWNTESGNCTFEWILEHTDYICSFAILGTKQFLTGSYDTTIKLWELGKKNSLVTLKGKEPCYSLGI